MKVIVFINNNISNFYIYISLVINSVTILKRKLAVKGKAHLLRAGMSKGYSLLKTAFASASGYLFLSRPVAASVSRFRFGYGPDLVSLARRGLGCSMGCRWCAHGVEDREHLLLGCTGVARITSPLLSYSNVVKVLGDGVDWSVVGPVLHELYLFCMTTST